MCSIKASIWNEYKVFCRTHVFCEQYHDIQATQSRMCINLNGKTGPAGSYETVSNWLVSQSTKELDFPQVPLILGPAIFQMNSLRLLIIQKTGSTTLDLYKNLIISGTRMELILTKFMIHIIRCYATILINICPWYIKNKSCYVDGVFSDKIDHSISAKQSEQLVIICALCGSVYQKSKIKCDTCKVNLRASQKRNLLDVQVNMGKSKISRVHEKEIVFNVQAVDTEQIIPHYSQRAHIQALDPLSVNHNSYDSVKLVPAENRHNSWHFPV